MQSLTKERMQPPVIILQQAIFYNIVILFVTKNHQQIQSRCLVHDFSFTDIVNDIMIEEQLY